MGRTATGQTIKRGDQMRWRNSLNRYWPRAAIAVALGLTGGAALARTTPPGCAASKLTGAMKLIPGSAGAGHIGYALTLKNTTTKPCRLGNHPKLKLLEANGVGLPTHVVKLGSSTTLTLAAGHKASASLRFSPDIPSAGEPSYGPCEPAAHKVRVTLTGPGTGSLRVPVSPATSVCGRGAIDEKPLM